MLPFGGRVLQSTHVFVRHRLGRLALEWVCEADTLEVNLLRYENLKSCVYSILCVYIFEDINESEHA